MNETGTSLLDILRSTPVREREDWLVIWEHDEGYRVYWTGTKWTDKISRAAHFADINGGVAVVQMLESIVPSGHLYTRPVKEV